MKKIIFGAVVTAGILMADVNIASCVGCHGSTFEKSALGKSKVVSEMTKEEIEIALKGYKDGSYGGVMKGVMKGQVAKYTEEDITALVELIKPSETTENTENTETTVSAETK